MSNKNIKKIIFNKIKEYNKIVITRHTRPDGDAIGSSMGLYHILKDSFPKKDIYLINEDYSDYLNFLGAEDSQQDDDFYKDALVIALDCGAKDRLSNSKIDLCKEIIRVDHHIDNEPYCELSLIEETSSSTCELITDFYLTFKRKLKLSQKAALCLYTGIVTDSGRFKYKSVSSRTFDCASFLISKDLDTDNLYAHLYLDNIDYLKYKAYALEKMQVTENGVVYIHVDKEMQEKFNLSKEEASNTVGLFDSIRGSLIWIAFIDNEDGTIRVRLRSRFVTINELAVKYNGGGHACASGATVSSIEELNALVNEADAILKKYKEENEGWL